jgi:hypothetical protein
MVTVSIVSHGHGGMVWGLVSQLLSCPEVAQVVVTCNIPESCPIPLPGPVELITNAQPKGFGANHNAAFMLARSECFCILNPDVELLGNPFPGLLAEMRIRNAALAAPMAKNRQGGIEDNFRSFPTLFSLGQRLLGLDRISYVYQNDSTSFSPDWVGGMFMLIPAHWYARLQGFDERYFLYYEDVDLCARLRNLGGNIIACPAVAIVHDGTRASHRNGQHFLWHVCSMARYLLTHGLPGQRPARALR